MEEYRISSEDLTLNRKSKLELDILDLNGKVIYSITEALYDEQSTNDKLDAISDFYKELKSLDFNIEEWNEDYTYRLKANKNDLTLIAWFAQFPKVNIEFKIKNKLFKSKTFTYSPLVSLNLYNFINISWNTSKEGFLWLDEMPKANKFIEDNGYKVYANFYNKNDYKLYSDTRKIYFEKTLTHEQYINYNKGFISEDLHLGKVIIEANAETELGTIDVKIPIVLPLDLKPENFFSYTENELNKIKQIEIL